MFAITVQNRGRLENNRTLIGFFNEQTKEINFVKEDALPDTLTNTNFFRPFGCYWREQKLFVVTHDKLIKLDNKGNYLEHETLHDFVNPHQIIETKKVRCYTNTGKDLIRLTHNNKTKTIDCKKLKETYGSNKEDSHHVNSLCLHDNKIFFCLHNNSVTTNKPSQYFYIDLDSEKIKYICEYGLSSHNCEIENNFLYTLSTKTGCLTCINWKSNKIVFELKLANPKHYFLRGLQLTEKHIIVGASSSIGTFAQILFIDRKTNDVTERKDIDGYNTVLDIKWTP